MLYVDLKTQLSLYHKRPVVVTRHHEQLPDSPGGTLMGPAAAAAGRISGASWGAGSIHGAYNASGGSRHSPGGPSMHRFNGVLGL